MKLFNTIAIVGALFAATEAATIRSTRPHVVSSRTDFTLSKLSNISNKINTLKQLDLKGMSPSKQEKMAETLMKKSKIL